MARQVTDSSLVCVQFFNRRLRNVIEFLKTMNDGRSGQERSQHNVYLRKRYLETLGGDAGAGEGTGTSKEDIARAKLLIERDERKKLQREMKNKNKALKKKNKENNRNNKKRKPNEEAILVQQEVI